MPDKPISDSYATQLAKEEARHEAEKKALVEEFEQQLKDNPEWGAEDIKEKLTEVMPHAYASLKDLILNAESEAVKANLIKFIFGVAMRDANTDPDSDPDQEFKKLLKDLGKKA